jgi:type I site-specific restriction endonuclease
VDRGNLGRQALKEFQQYATPDDGRKFTELYNVQHLQSNRIDDVSRVCIATIQRVYSMLKGDELDPELEEQSAFEAMPLRREPVPVEYNPAIPIDTFDVIITDERLTYREIRALADTLQAPPRALTPDRLWAAYQQLEQSRVRGSGQRMLADIVSLVRFAIGEDMDLAPFADHVRERFEAWLATQEQAGRSFTPEQRRWLEAIRDHIAGSVSMGLEDFQLAPFDQQGGLGRAYSLFGQELEALLEELNRELAA